MVANWIDEVGVDLRGSPELVPPDVLLDVPPLELVDELPDVPPLDVPPLELPPLDVPPLLLPPELPLVDDDDDDDDDVDDGRRRCRGRYAPASSRGNYWLGWGLRT